MKNIINHYKCEIIDYSKQFVLFYKQNKCRKFIRSLINFHTLDSNPTIITLLRHVKKSTNYALRVDKKIKLDAKLLNTQKN